MVTVARDTEHLLIPFITYLSCPLLMSFTLSKILYHSILAVLLIPCGWRRNAGGYWWIGVHGGFHDAYV